MLDKLNSPTQYAAIYREGATDPSYSNIRNLATRCFNISTLVERRNH